MEQLPDPTLIDGGSRGAAGFASQLVVALDQ
jgi:hypothetical protein